MELDFLCTTQRAVLWSHPCRANDVDWTCNIFAMGPHRGILARDLLFYTLYFFTERRPAQGSILPGADLDHVEMPQETLGARLQKN